MLAAAISLAGASGWRGCAAEYDRRNNFMLKGHRWLHRLTSVVIFLDHQSHFVTGQMEQEPETSNLVASINHELNVLARRIPFLAGSEGSFVGDITDVLYHCALVSQDKHFGRDPQFDHEYRIRGVGIFFKQCLYSSRIFGHPLFEHKFKLYTTFRKLSNVPVIMYPRNWYEELINTRILDTHLKALMENVCKMLWTGNIILYISPEPPTLEPPWVLDDLLRQRLAYNDLPGFIDNYEWALSTSLPISISQKESSQKYPGQRSVTNGSSSEAYAASPDRKMHLHTLRTSDTGEGPKRRKAFQESRNMSSDAMNLGWNLNFDLLESLQEGRSSRPSWPSVMEAEPQPRPLPAVQKLVPAQGSVKGGTEVTLLGNGFYEGLEVVFGDTEATATTFWGNSCLVCIAPPAVKAGNITIRFKEDNHHQNVTQQQLPFQTCVYEYIDDQESDKCTHASTALEHNKQRSREDAKSTPQQQITGILTTTTPTISAQPRSLLMSNNFALIRCLARCLAIQKPAQVPENEILELSQRSLVSLSKALPALPLADETILCAILLWFMEEFTKGENRAKPHWDGIKVLLQVRTDFDVTRALALFSTQASPFLTDRQRESVAEVIEFIAAAFNKAREVITDSDGVARSIAPSAAPTPAATVYSPWSETDVDPPPYMLSPTPLKQACLIYAAVNASRKEIRIT